MLREGLHPLKTAKKILEYVQSVSDSMHKAEGFIKSYGIGEMPYFKQTTFSIWENKTAMKQFAYKHKDILM